jgi:hypothetical protein
MPRWSKIVIAVIAAGSLATAAWMLAAPEHWYHHVPAGVPDFGLYNPHFVRDLGVAFLVVGIALLWGVRSPEVAPVTLAVAAMFYGFHAVIHVFDTLRGHVHADHWLIDFPTTYLPAILLAVIWSRRARHHRSA